MKVSKKILIIISIFIFLLGGLFYRFSLFPFNKMSDLKNYFYEKKFIKETAVNKVKIKSRSLIKYDFEKNLNLYSLYPDEVNINLEKKELIINQNLKKNFFIILGTGTKEKKNSILKDWNIKFKNIKNNEKIELNIIDQYFDKYGVRGCVNIYELNLKNVNFDVSDCNLENALELVSVNGNINQIILSNSSYDGLDIDFSNLNINQTIIQNSGADCIDLFKGKYNFKNTVVYNCKNPTDSDLSYTIFENLKIFTKEQKNEFKKYKIFK